MKILRKKATVYDILLKTREQTRFDKEYNIHNLSLSPLSVDFELYSTLENVDLDIVELSGPQGGTFHRIDTIEDTDGGVIILIDNKLYKRQFTGAAKLEWFGRLNGNTIENVNLTAAIKYGKVELNPKYTYVLSDGAIRVQNNCVINGYGARVEFNNTKLFVVRKLVEYFTWNYTVFNLTSGDALFALENKGRCRYLDLVTFNTFYKQGVLDASIQPRTNGLVITNTPVYINGQKKFNNKIKLATSYSSEANGNYALATKEVNKVDNLIEVIGTTANVTIKAPKTFTRQPLISPAATNNDDAVVTVSELSMLNSIFQGQVNTPLANGLAALDRVIANVPTTMACPYPVGCYVVMPTATDLSKKYAGTTWQLQEGAKWFKPLIASNWQPGAHIYGHHILSLSINYYITGQGGGFTYRYYGEAISNPGVLASFAIFGNGNVAILKYLGPKLLYTTQELDLSGMSGNPIMLCRNRRVYIYKRTR